MGATRAAQNSKARRYAAVRELTIAGKATREIAAILGCCKDLVRHYRRMAKRDGFKIPRDPWFVTERNEGNEKWKMLGR
jgi:transposase